MYSDAQKDMIRKLADARATPWHLAGQWYFGEKHRGLTRLRKPALEPGIEALVQAAWRLSHATPASFDGGAPYWDYWSSKLVVHHLQNAMAWLCAGLLWEALFPEIFVHTRIAERVIGLEHVDADKLALWVNENLDRATSPLYADLVRLGTQDCVRMARDGVPEGF